MPLSTDGQIKTMAGLRDQSFSAESGRRKLLEANDERLAPSLRSDVQSLGPPGQNDCHILFHNSGSMNSQTLQESGEFDPELLEIPVFNSKLDGVIEIHFLLVDLRKAKSE